MMTTFQRAATLVVAALLTTSLASAQTDDALRADIEALKKGQEAIQKDLQEIKRLLANQQKPAAEAALPASLDISNEPARGSKTAKVALIEYSDYQCPFCGRYATETYPQIQKDYVQTGKIRYVFRDLPLSFHQNAFKAAEASHCAGEQGKFWEMHERLFSNQSTIAAADLPKHAEALGLNATQFQQCLDSGRFAAAIKKDVGDANGVGISGTPSFLIGVVQPNGTVKVEKKLVGARSYAEFKTMLDTLLSQ